MGIKKRKLMIGLFIVMFTAFSSFEMVKEETPCYYFQMYFSKSLADPAWGDFGEWWYCTSDFAPICTYIYIGHLNDFELCLRGFAVPYGLTTD